jgi:hypothetical protein
MTISTQTGGAGRAPWRKSTYSGGGNNCVEVAEGVTDIAVRDSKNPDGGDLVFSAAAWTAFTAGVKTGGYGIK